MTFSIDTISALLAGHTSVELLCDDGGKTRAAVAMILRQGKRGVELLFIQRSRHENDPWSGNVAFPGGKVEQGEESRQAAERETIEEIGLDLNCGIYLGQMPVVRGSYLPVQVSCFVYWMSAAPVELVLNGEVFDTYWADLDDLDNQAHHLIAPVRFRGEEFEVPAIKLSWPGSPVLWGLTYRLVMHFLEMYRDAHLEERVVAFSPGIGRL
ncbi:MAG: CoA pyrophosphatase [Desulfuromonadales bacterium]|nr:CoA pyrophosphatase [Desulfuromonadales bacterium]